MKEALLVYHLVLFCFTLGSLSALYLLRQQKPMLISIADAISLIILAFCLAFFYPVDGFGRIQLLVWGFFFYLPLYLAGAAALLARIKGNYATVLLVLLVVILWTALDAFVIEPQHLQVTRITLHSPKIAEPVKAVLLADIQTDSPGSYEERVLQLAAEEDPDLVLFAGDYLQLHDPDQYQAAVKDLNRILLAADLNPPLGIYAVRGNVDGNGWQEIFQGLDVHVFESTESLELDSLVVTGISWRDSQDTDLAISSTEKYQLVLGHSPNFSLGDNGGDLLLAGHTHGGQFQIPGFGPLLTLSSVPREWASGLTEIKPGQYLLVSRGIGLERGDAPRLRLFCRPELIIITLEPDGD
jgi:predicted MPP superfamily phosphohydrolase